MDIKNYNSNINFQAKFLKSGSLYDIASYAVDHGKFDELNQARKNIDKALLSRRLRVQICYTDDKPTLIISRYEPIKGSVALTTDDYELTAQTEFIANKRMNPLKYGLQILLQLGNNAPHNNIYKKVVIDKGKVFEPLLA